MKVGNGPKYESGKWSKRHIMNVKFTKETELVNTNSSSVFLHLSKINEQFL